MRFTIPAVLLLVASVVPAHAAGVDIPYRKEVLDNGLTVVVHEDHKAPVVAVSVWYHVGSARRTARADRLRPPVRAPDVHGSENHKGEYFDAVRSGRRDRHERHDLVRPHELLRERADHRARHGAVDGIGPHGPLLGAIGQAKLDEQRGVVQNEKRQGENQPYGRVEELHPRGHRSRPSIRTGTTIGSMEDLDAASLDDVKQWFQTYYGAANTVLVLAGDIDAARREAKGREVFRRHPGRPAGRRARSMGRQSTGSTRRRRCRTACRRRASTRSGTCRRIGHGGRQRPRARRRSSSPAARRLDSISGWSIGIGSRRTVVLASGRLEISRQFTVVVTARPGVDLGAIEKAVDEEMARFHRRKDQLPQEGRARQTQLRAGFVRGIERIGGFGGKSDILAREQSIGGSPDVLQDRS